MKKLNQILTLLSLVVFAACEKIPSDKIDISQFYFSMKIENSDTDTSKCYTRVSVKSEVGDSIELVDGDYLTCNGVQMRKDTDVTGNYIFYSAYVADPVDHNYRIEFFKDNNYYTSGVVTLFDPIGLKSPGNYFSLLHNQDLLVTFTPSVHKGSYVAATLRGSYTDMVSFPNKQVDIEIKSSNSASDGYLRLRNAAANYKNLPDEATTLTLTLIKERRGVVSNNVNGVINAERKVELTGTLRKQ